MTGIVKAMRYVKYAMLGLGAIAVLLCLIYDVFQYGVHGVLLFVFCLVPTALAGLSLKLWGGMPRWASAVSMVSFLVAAAKSSGDISSLNNIMMAAFFGMILALVLLIKPDLAKQPEPEAVAQAGYPPQGYPQQGNPQQGNPQQQGYVDPQQPEYAAPQPGQAAPQPGYAPQQVPPAGYDPNQGTPQA